MIDVADVRTAQSLIQTDEHGTFIAGGIVGLQTQIQILAASSQQIIPSHLEIHRCLSQITYDIWNIGTLLGRIEWTRQHALNNAEFRDAWRFFVSVDIAHFHIEYRSVFDYVSSSLKLLARHPGSIPPKYRQMYKWLTEAEGMEQKKRIGQLGQQESTLVMSTPWFMGFRDIRDALVHRGSYILVFGGPEDGTLFQVITSDHISAKVRQEVFLVNENVADFELYCAVWMTRLLLFLEDFARVLSQSMEAPILEQTRTQFFGLEVVRQWMGKLERKLGSS